MPQKTDSFVKSTDATEDYTIKKNLETIFEGVQFLCPTTPNINQLLNQKPLVPFSDLSLDFLDALSKALISNAEAKKLPDVVTFAFWCRKGNMLKLKSKYNDGSIRLGRGVAFHISPSNVPINFAYSLVAGLLSGNVNIVRVPSKAFEQTAIICKSIDNLIKLNKFNEMAHRIVLVKYDRQSNATEYFSSICDIRVIWGGDQSIADIRKFPIPPRSFDITFADRYSLCAINADAYINEKKPKEIANLFYNDTFFYDQNACSAPHLVVWTGKGENIEQSKCVFWSQLETLVTEKYPFEPITAVDKLTAIYRQAIEYEDIKVQKSENNYIKRIELSELKQEIENYRCYSGYFCEYIAEDLNEISKIVNLKYQTMAYYGYSLEKLTDVKISNRLVGIDRIVPIGQTATFSLTWDGYNLIHSMSNLCDIY